MRERAGLSTTALGAKLASSAVHSRFAGADLAAIWSDVLSRPIVYGGDDRSGFEQNIATFMPKWMAYEMRLMAERYVSDGLIPDEGDVGPLTTILGRPLHSYRDFGSKIA